MRYGLIHDIGTDNPLKYNYLETAALVRDVARAKSWRGRFGYVFGRPGWTESRVPLGLREALGLSVAEPPVHLLLGTDCLAAVEAKIGELQADIRLPRGGRSRSRPTTTDAL